MLLETQRLTIRRYQSQDWQDALQYLGNPATMYFLPEAPFTATSVQSFITQPKTATEFLAVVDKQSGRVIGHLFFAPFFGEHSYEIGWVFNPEYVGQGLVQEAATAVLDYGFKTLKLHRVIATCQPENERSYRLMERLGMRREGHFKQCIPVEGGWWDEYSYAILQEEWETK